MVAAKLDQSRVLVTKFRQNRLTLKGRSAGQRHTDRQTRLKVMALQVCNWASKKTYSRDHLSVLLSVCLYISVCMWVCVTVEINRPRKQQQQSFIRNFSRSFVTVPSPTEPGFVCSSVFVTEIHCKCVSSVQISACRLECNGCRGRSGCMLLAFISHFSIQHVVQRHDRMFASFMKRSFLAIFFYLLACDNCGSDIP